MVAIISASGTALPTFLMFPRMNFKNHMLHNAPPRYGGAATASGWMNSELFLPVLQHSVKHQRPTEEHPRLMIPDNHESHTSITAISYAKENGIILLTLPPHTSHKLQPLDVVVFASFKKLYNTACCDLMADTGRSSIIYDVAGLVGRAFPLVFTSQNICSGFRACGIELLNRDIFRPEDYLPTYLINQPLQTSQDECKRTEQISPEDIWPHPKAPLARRKKKKNKKSKSIILTNTSVKIILEDEATLTKERKMKYLIG
ncbi:uncharacterized protein LOC126117522 [Schistocerca cancellata]|uniref:uncharacterized protein LOC126117522 n=1 Tax=Schistocerca cancellata TaxID=274614 RepID=UPI002119803C|nr:uncharacterized protein LOC126117522 [Schistocerca cancellata]